MSSQIRDKAGSSERRGFDLVVLTNRSSLPYSSVNPVQVKTLKAESFCRNPTLAKCGGEAQHFEKVRI
jgi:hypothetical protein